MASKRRPSAIFDSGSRCLPAQLIPLFKMVPLVSDESDRIVGMYFREIRNFTSRPESNRALSGGNDPEFVLVKKNAFQ